MGKTITTGLKLRILDRSLWKSLPKAAWLNELAVEGTAKTQTFEETYYDTPSRTLWAAGYVFRISREQGGWKATLKETGHSGGGSHQFREWKTALTGPEAPLDALERIPGAEKALKLLQGKLSPEPLFKAVFTRWSILLHPRAGAGLLELTLDNGFISAGEKDEELLEAEIELKEGPFQDLLAFGAELARRCPLMPEDRSKYRRGLQLAGLQSIREGRGVKTWPPTAEKFLSEAVEKVLVEQAAYYANPAGIEELHDLRVGLRKLRSRLSFAAPLFPEVEAAEWKKALCLWSRRMARIRELDMLQEEWNVAAGYMGSVGFVSPLGDYLKSRRDKLAEPLCRAIGKGRLTADLLAFWSWAASEDEKTGTGPAWSDYWHQRLKKQLRKFSRQAKEVDAADAEAMHGLRINAKKARYVLERYAQHEDARDTLRLAGELKNLQDCLGDMQDSVQGTLLLHKEKRRKLEPELEREVALLTGWQARRGHDSANRFNRQRKKFRKDLRLWLSDRM